MVYVTRRVHFNAAHRMHNPAWDADTNAATFGPCNNANWHGHNYELEVTVAGTPDPDTGYVLDLARLNRIVQTCILDKVDHKNLNLDVDFMRDVIPSTEHFAIRIWQQLEPQLRPHRLHAIRLYETARNYVEYRGE
ncbi:MAG: 6-carboxytetrahydropterin synthase [Bacteroidetes bacterium]|jgi:6-pyruvoyltetrahydropterin/6-carboxytetrahydropterin synthase|nr:6-carboxytetrahydropterin synthase [Bacteroidota bacterium]